tara:strand:+ start:8 stop:298 length:291 start_codon:yes stop_codon:yes gene_type:complete
MGVKEMKPPKRALKAKEVIDNMVNLLEYYMSGTKEFRRLVKEDIQFLEDYLNEISEDHKLHNIRFASKLKSLWKSEMKEKDKVIKKLKEELGDSID